MKKKKILMCGSALSVKGGIVSVIKNYLGYPNWEKFDVRYVPTHIEGNKIILALYFVLAYVRVSVTALLGQYDIVYLHTAERGSFYRKALLAQTMKFFGKKVVLHHHAAQFEEFYESLPESRKHFVKETLHQVDLNLVLSNRLIPMITSKSPQATVKVLYNAVKTYPENPYNREARNVLFLGELGERKGAYDLLEAIKRVDAVLPGDIQFYLCGNGEVDKVQGQVDTTGISHRIAHIGWVDGGQKATILKNTMINVLPSYNEGLPMTILETMAYGIPNISTEIASIPEVIQSGRNGILIQPGDIDKLQSSLCILCMDTTQRNCMSEECWKDVTNNFAMESHIRKLEEYLSAL